MDPLIAVTADWLADVRAAMTEKKISRAALARRVGVSKTTMTHLLNGTSHHSRLVPAISKALGIPLPADEVTDVEWQEWLAFSRKLTKDDRRRIVRLVKGLQDDGE